MDMDVDGAGSTVEEEDDVPTCTRSSWTVRDVSPSSLRHLDRSTPLAPASPPLLRYHGTRCTCRLRRVFLRYAEHKQAPYTDPRTGLRYHDKSVYDLIKNLVCSLSPPVARPRRHSFTESRRCKRLPLRQRRQSHRQVAPADPSSSSSRQVSGRLVVCTLSSCMNSSSIISDMCYAALSIASRIRGWNVSRTWPVFSSMLGIEEPCGTWDVHICT